MVMKHCEYSVCHAVVWNGKNNAEPSLIMYERPLKCSFVSSSVFTVNKRGKDKSGSSSWTWQQHVMINDPVSCGPDNCYLTMTSNWHLGSNGGLILLSVTTLQHNSPHCDAGIQKRRRGHVTMTHMMIKCTCVTQHPHIRHADTLHLRSCIWIKMFCWHLFVDTHISANCMLLCIGV